MDRKEVFAILEQVAPVINQTATEKGFWKDGENRNKPEMVMLMVSELGEALEAHRKSRFALHKLNLYQGLKPLLNQSEPYTNGLQTQQDFDKRFVDTFEDSIKDTVEDEIADVMIRLLDYMYGWKLNIRQSDFRKHSTGNFAHDLLRITNYMLESYHHQVEHSFFSGADWNYTLASIIAFCDHWNIDLISHMKWKMKYNNTREVLHGKKY